MKPMIEGVSIFPLRIIEDDRGAVMHMMRRDTPQFINFGEIYFSCVKAGVVKAWKKHREMVQNLSVPAGAIRLVIYDDRADSSTCGMINEIVTGRSCEKYELICLPANVWYGFIGEGADSSLIANCASMPHDPDEVERLPFDSALIPYAWDQV